MTEQDLKYQDLKREYEALKKENERLRFSNSLLEKQLKEQKDHIGDVSKMVDLVEVTRCKDCKYRIDGYCDVWSYCGHEKVKEVDFCSYGEKVKQ